MYLKIFLSENNGNTYQYVAEVYNKLVKQGVCGGEGYVIVFVLCVHGPHIAL